MTTLTQRSGEALARRIARADACILLLDFDGTLVGLKRDPTRVHLPPRTRALIAALSLRCRVGIISGRALTDIRERVGIPDLWYAGNHGLEWIVEGAHGEADIPAPERRALRSLVRAASRIAQDFRGLIVEDKHLTLIIRFDRVATSKRAECIRRVRAMLAPHLAKKLITVRAKPLDLDIRPRVRWHKGHAARHMHARAARMTGRKALPVFIGDDVTDEDAFRLLKARSGVTIRVGRAKRSSARYCLPSRARVSPFLAMLLRALNA